MNADERGWSRRKHRSLHAEVSSFGDSTSACKPFLIRVYLCPSVVKKFSQPWFGLEHHRQGNPWKIQALQAV
jgi:hypothetical protein